MVERQTKETTVKGIPGKPAFFLPPELPLVTNEKKKKKTENEPFAQTQSPRNSTSSSIRAIMGN